MSKEFVRNPITGRFVRKNTRTYKKLVKDGYLDVEPTNSGAKLTNVKMPVEPPVNPTAELTTVNLARQPTSKPVRIPKRNMRSTSDIVGDVEEEDMTKLDQLINELLLDIEDDYDDEYDFESDDE